MPWSTEALLDNAFDHFTGAGGRCLDRMLSLRQSRVWRSGTRITRMISCKRIERKYAYG